MYLFTHTTNNNGQYIKNNLLVYILKKTTIRRIISHTYRILFPNGIKKQTIMKKISLNLKRLRKKRIILNIFI